MARGSLGLVPGALNLSLFMALSLLLLLLAPGPARAQATSTQGAGAASPTIYSPPAGSKFKYSGCFNETTDLPGTARERALDGSHRVSPGSMTVQACIDFCDGGDKPYKYAGLEFSRECWCGNRLSVLATKFDDSECNTACDGDQKSTSMELQGRLLACLLLSPSPLASLRQCACSSSLVPLRGAHHIDNARLDLSTKQNR
ncbi:hypothetical protein RB595_000933 [Gaeumannomyces hyphopodioides]